MLEVVNKIIEMSIQASFVICMILIVRFLFLKLNIPKQLIQILWVIPLFRLVCPVTIATGFSIVPLVERSVDRASNTYDVNVTMPFGDSFVSSGTMSTWEKPDSGNVIVGDPNIAGGTGADNVLTGGIEQEFVANIVEEAGVLLPLHIFAVVWMVGIACLVVYSVISTIRLRKKLVGSICVEKNYYRADHIQTPFVLGVFRPKIYLPSTLPEHSAKMIIKHEELHILRKDHIVKLIVFAITCVYWFNPFVWILYVFFCRDIENAVDEKVVCQLEDNERQLYASLLLALSTGNAHLFSAPLAFGEGDVKGRIKNVVKYKKPIMILVIVAVVVVVVLAAGLLSSPSKSNAVFKGGKSINNVQYIGFFPALIPEEADAKDGYKITTDVIPFADKCFSPQLGERIKSNWKMTEQQHYASGNLVGSCYEYMDTWEACESFIGFEIENPLKTCSWLVPADANTGMSLEEERVYEFAYPERNHCEVHFYGDRKGDVEYVVVSEGYLVNDIRVIMDAMCYGENYPEEYGTWYAFAEDVDFEVYTLNRANGGSAVALFVPVDTRYSSNIYLAQNNVYYHISVLGDNEHVNEVRDVTAKLLKLFEVEAVDELLEIDELPLYEYTGEDALLGAICNYLVAEDLISDTSHGTIRIPAPVLLKIDDSDKTDIKVWGNFYSYGYVQDGTKLIMEIGGECPGLMHLAKTEDGYMVTNFEVVRDGSYFTDDMQELCKGHSGLYEKMRSISYEERDFVQKEFIEAYVSHNNLNITAYQDPGQDLVELDVEVDASAVTDAQIISE